MSKMLNWAHQLSVGGKYAALKNPAAILTNPKSSKSSAQVARLVSPAGSPNTAGQSPGPKNNKSKQSYGIKLKSGELELIRKKANAQGLNVNAFIRAKALGDDFVSRPPEWLRNTLLKLYAELAGQGNNLNQIARKVNQHAMSADNAIELIDAHRKLVFQTLERLELVLAGKRPPHDY